jgi:hypothetical protein
LLVMPCLPGPVAGTTARRLLTAGFPGTDAACYARPSPRKTGACMPHIALNSAEPGIRGLLRYRPQTARPLSE